MAGDMRFLSPDTGVVVRGPMAMGLTTAAQGVDHIGGNIFYAVDTKRLYKLSYNNGALNVISNVNVINKIEFGSTVYGMCSDPAGHWIAATRQLERDGDPPVVTIVLNIFRFDLDGNLIGQLPNFGISALLSLSGVDLTHHEGNVWICWNVGGVGSTTYNIRKFYYRDARSIQQYSTTTNNRRNRAIAYYGGHMYVIKNNNSNLGIFTLQNTQVVAINTGPGVAADGICMFRGGGHMIQESDLEEGVGIEEAQGSDGHLIVHVT